MKGWMPAVGILLVAAGVSLWLFGRDGTPAALPSPAVAEPTPTPATVPGQQPESHSMPPVTNVTSAEEPAVILTWAARFAAADDYNAFVESVFPEATDGDANAQFWLATALQYCDGGYREYFDHRNAPGGRTFDEAMQQFKGRDAWEIDELKRVHARCQRLQERRDLARFGAAPQWQERAANGGSPIAVARQAGTLYRDFMIRTPEDAAKLARVRALSRQALQSREPAVFMELAAVAPFLGNPDLDPAKPGAATWAWILLACQRGLDCSPEVPWMQLVCRYDLNCQTGETGVQFMQRALANEYPEMERIAAEIGANIDAGNWEALGLED